MSNAIRLAAVTAFAMTLAAGCGGKTTCDELADYIENDCGVAPVDGGTGDAAEVECDDGSENACIAGCGLDLDCSFYSATGTAATGTEMLDMLAGYTECLASCAGGTGS